MGPPGPGGGYGLDVDTTLPPLNLTPAEAAALATALAATRAMPFAEAGRYALMKLAGVMASARKDAASQLVSQIRVVQGSGGPVNPVSDVIQRALIDSVAVELTYLDAQAHLTLRIVEPVGSSAPVTAGISPLVPPPPGAPRLSPGQHRRSHSYRRPVTHRSLDAVLSEISFDMV